MDHSPILIGSVKTPALGQVWAAVSEHGLVAVEYGVSRRAFEANVHAQTGREVGYAPGRLADILVQIRQYADGQRRKFDLPIDWSVLASDFQRSALKAVFAIPYGETRTYAQVAAGIGHANAPRAVGRANATNPMPLVIPCHRLIGTDGKLHGYGGKGGLKTKEWLLKMEGAR
jgi:O-6-methylguanine DNA methyltransferase